MTDAVHEPYRGRPETSSVALLSSATAIRAWPSFACTAPFEPLRSLASSSIVLRLWKSRIPTVGSADYVAGEQLCVIFQSWF